MLVVVPIVLLVIAGLIAAMVSMVGDSMAANSRSATVYEVQDSLDRIEQDTRTAINFMGNFDYFTAPQGEDGATQAFTSSGNDLILTQQATTASPYVNSRNLVYYDGQPSACGADPTGNRSLVLRTIYFVKDSTLWRRTIVNPWNQNGTPDADTTCAVPWQRDTCPAGSTVGSGPTYTCNGLDEKLLENVTSFTTTYYTTTGATTLDPAQASSVGVAVVVSKSVRGESISQTSTLRVSRRNDIPAPPAPTSPVIDIYNPDEDAFNNSLLVTFKWSSANASAYSYQTSTDGTTWTAPKPTTLAYASVNVAYGGQLAYIRVTAYNDQGKSATVPWQKKSNVWTNCALQNGWQPYSTGYYTTPSYTYTSSKIVMLRGIMKNGNTAPGTVICRLPTGFRTDKRQLFQTAMFGGATSGVGRIDVQANGDVTVYGANTTWTSLDQVRFIPTNSGYSWSANLTPYNGWLHIGASDVSNVVVTTDNIGRKHIRGIGKSGNTSNGFAAFALPGGFGVSKNDMVGASASLNSSSYTQSAVQIASDGYIKARGVPTTSPTAWSIQFMWWPSSVTGWSTITPLAGWDNYHTSWSSLECIKGTDNVVSIRVLVSGGTTATGTILGNIPAACGKPSGYVICQQPDSYPGATGYSRVDIAPDSKIYIREGVENGFLSLAGCDYLAE